MIEEVSTKEKWADGTKTNAEVIGWVVWGLVIGALSMIAVMMV